MEYERKIKVIYLDGKEYEHTMRKMPIRKRNTLFNTYLDMTKIMKGKGKVADTDIVSLIKKDMSVLDFILDAIEACCPELDLDKVDGQQCDEIFNENSAFILGLAESKN
jgi:hypothetical protein